MLCATRVMTAQRSVAAPFNPLTQVTPLHAVWASDPLWTPPADGAAVTSMRNASGGGDPTQGSAGFKPLYRAAAASLGSRPAVEFDGTDDRLVVDITDVALPFKCVAVYRHTVSTNSLNPVGTGGNSSAGLTISGTNFFAMSNGTVLASSKARDTLGHVFRANHSSGALNDLFIDGTQVITAGSAGSSGLTYFKLGCAGSGATHGRFAPCQIGFVGFYSSGTSDSDLATLAADLKTYYAL